MIMHCFACDNEFDGMELKDQPETELRNCYCPCCGRKGYIIDVWFGGKSGIHHNDLCVCMKEYKLRCERINNAFEMLSNSEELYEANDNIRDLTQFIKDLRGYLDVMEVATENLQRDLN